MMSPSNRVSPEASAPVKIWMLCWMPVSRLSNEIVNGSPFADRKWLLHTADAHRLYAKLGFGAPSERLMERQ